MMDASVRECQWVSVGMEVEWQDWRQKGRSGQSRAEPRVALAPDAAQPIAARAFDSATKSLVSVVARAWTCLVRLPFLDCHRRGCDVLAPTLFPAPPVAIGNTAMFHDTVPCLPRHISKEPRRHLGRRPHHVPSRHPSVPTARHKKR
ncbi:hypothetical protein COCMIDRAFT_86730 [Bipolaris oryzae ATCC 44560]|uniref:Uncharacterized protein n=1 Tax=Bipolaris oryzae ATCC 44560 TaxID=930090 RepID=W6ZF95_COCMI|nr:uncharacterized protein COCMIDRAFT_86730 [Bipolaris oryzae ATCC 44560]EUC48680.1 hypothetical protein COCMIDRAFT_86730 [Bipolaris oryzae ATCC 44560]